MSAIMKLLFPKIGILFLLISVVSTGILMEKDSLSIGVNATNPNCTAECFQDRKNLASVYNQRRSNPICENFYWFACGNFKSINISLLEKLGSSQDSEFTRNIIKVKERRNKIIEESLNTTDDSVPYKLIKTFYKPCKDYERRLFLANTSDVNFLVQQLSKLGGWPVLEGENWNEEAFDWKKIVIESQNIDRLFHAFIDFQVLHNQNMANEYYLEPSPFRENLINRNETQRNGILDYMVGVAVLLGADEKIARKDLKNSLEFELELINVINNSTSNSTQQNSTENVEMSIAEMIDRWPSVNWTEFLNNITQSYINYDNSTNITVTNIRYVDNLIKMISSTPKRVQANYGLWRMIMQFVIYTHNSSFQRLRKNLSLIISPDNLSKFKIYNLNCLDLVDRLLSLSVDALYVRKYVDKRVKSIATDMYKEIQRKLVELVRSADWIDEETRKNAVKTAENIKGSIAYSDDLLDDQKMEEYYADLGELVDSGLLENIVKLKKFKSIKNFEIIGVGIYGYYRAHYNVTINRASQVASAYDEVLNEFEIMSGILQGLYFNINYPNYINYGAIGTGIGHELSHAYHTLSRNRDESGIINNKWSEKSEQEIKKKENCFVDQYNQSDYYGRVNGYQTLDENVADNLGVKIAYLAYQDWVARNGPEQSLPGLEFTPNQLFWLSYANIWCTQYTEKGLDYVFYEDVHSPNFFRVNEVLKNSPNFSLDFDCPLGSPMNPENKCTLF